MYIRMLKLIIETFEYSKIGLKVEIEVSLDLGALKYHAYQHLISYLEFSVLNNNCELSNIQLILLKIGYVLFIFTVTEPTKCVC